jgi:esterase/lipase superfamily enzyme
LQEKYHKFYSPSLGRDIQMLEFGHWGYPILLFPTSRGRYYQNKDFGLTKAVEWFVNSGKVKLYCIDSIDGDSWYARHLHPALRVLNHICYDRMLNDELIPYIRSACHVDKIAVGGCSFGGFQAANFAFKHPDKVAHMFSMGGAFDIKTFLDGYYDDNVYFNNPVDFMQNEEGWKYGHMKIVLGTSEHDFCKGDNQYMSHILHTKGIGHWLDIRPYANHDWPIWCEMFHDYVAQM